MLSNCWYLEIGHGRSICNMEIDKCYNWGLFPLLKGGLLAHHCLFLPIIAPAELRTQWTALIPDPPDFSLP